MSQSEDQGRAATPFAAAARNGSERADKTGRVADRAIRAFPKAFGSFVSLILILNTPTLAQEESTRRRYTAPKDWALGLDGKTLIPPGAGDNAVVKFTPSKAFASTAGQWATEAWHTVASDLKLVSGPVPGTQGAFLTHMGIFEKPDRTRVWLVLNTLVHDGWGEAMIFRWATPPPHAARNALTSRKARDPRSEIRAAQPAMNPRSP